VVLQTEEEADVTSPDMSVHTIPVDTPVVRYELASAPANMHRHSALGFFSVA
jgi:hypothetical protein